MNIFDTFPRRDLNPEADQWGRTVEEKIYALESGVTAGQQSVDGLNRNTAATLQDLAKQLGLLDEQVQRIDNLFSKLPQGSQANISPTGFAVTGAGWRNIASVTFTAPSAGSFSIAANAVGRLRTTLTSGNFEVAYRLVARGTTGPTVEGAAWNPSGIVQNSFSLSWGWNFSVGDGEQVVVAIQANPQGTAIWNANAGTYVTLQADADFRVS